jgi:hypothetical protein
MVDVRTDNISIMLGEAIEPESSDHWRLTTIIEILAFESAAFHLVFDRKIEYGVEKKFTVFEESQ